MKDLRERARIFLPICAKLLGYCGLTTVWSFTKRLLDTVDEVDDRELFGEVTSALAIYLDRIHIWIHGTFPWEVGVLFPQKTKEEIEETNATWSR